MLKINTHALQNILIKSYIPLKSFETEQSRLWEDTTLDHTRFSCQLRKIRYSCYLHLAICKVYTVLYSYFPGMMCITTNPNNPSGVSSINNICLLSINNNASCQWVITSRLWPQGHKPFLLCKKRTRTHWSWALGEETQCFRFSFPLATVRTAFVHSSASWFMLPTLHPRTVPGFAVSVMWWVDWLVFFETKNE